MRVLRVWDFFRWQAKVFAGSLVFLVLAAALLIFPSQAKAIGPDLVMTTVSGPTAAQTEQVVTVSSTVKNQGQETAEETFLVRYYLSADTTVGSGDINLGEQYVYSLAAGAERALSLNVRIPTTITADGTYYLLAVADIYNGVKDESDESNNVGVGSQIAITKM